MLYSFVSCVWCVALRGVFYPPPFLLPLALQELTTSARSLSVLFVGRGALHIKFHGVLRKIGRPATLFFCNHELISNLFSVISLFFSCRSLHSPASSMASSTTFFQLAAIGEIDEAARLARGFFGDGGAHSTNAKRGAAKKPTVAPTAAPSPFHGGALSSLHASSFFSDVLATIESWHVPNDFTPSHHSLFADDTGGSAAFAAGDAGGFTAVSVSIAAGTDRTAELVASIPKSVEGILAEAGVPTATAGAAGPSIGGQAQSSPTLVNAAKGQSEAALAVERWALVAAMFDEVPRRWRRCMGMHSAGSGGDAAGGDVGLGAPHGEADGQRGGPLLHLFSCGWLDDFAVWVPSSQPAAPSPSSPAGNGSASGGWEAGRRFLAAFSNVDPFQSSAASSDSPSIAFQLAEGALLAAQLPLCVVASVSHISEAIRAMAVSPDPLRTGLAIARLQRALSRYGEFCSSVLTRLDAMGSGGGYPFAGGLGEAAGVGHYSRASFRGSLSAVYGAAAFPQRCAFLLVLEGVLEGLVHTARVFFGDVAAPPLAPPQRLPNPSFAGGGDAHAHGQQQQPMLLGVGPASPSPRHSHLSTVSALTVSAAPSQLEPRPRAPSPYSPSSGNFLLSPATAAARNGSHLSAAPSHMSFGGRSGTGGSTLSALGGDDEGGNGGGGGGVGDGGASRGGKSGGFRIPLPFVGRKDAKRSVSSARQDSLPTSAVGHKAADGVASSSVGPQQPLSPAFARWAAAARAGTPNVFLGGQAGPAGTSARCRGALMAALGEGATLGLVVRVSSLAPSHTLRCWEHNAFTCLVTAEASSGVGGADADGAEGALAGGLGASMKDFVWCDLFPESDRADEGRRRTVLASAVWRILELSAATAAPQVSGPSDGALASTCANSGGGGQHALGGRMGIDWDGDRRMIYCLSPEPCAAADAPFFVVARAGRSFGAWGPPTASPSPLRAHPSLVGGVLSSAALPPGTRATSPTPSAVEPKKGPRGLLRRLFGGKDKKAASQPASTAATTGPPKGGGFFGSFGDADSVRSGESCTSALTTATTMTTREEAATMQRDAAAAARVALANQEPRVRAAMHEYYVRVLMLGWVPLAIQFETS